VLSCSLEFWAKVRVVEDVVRFLLGVLVFVGGGGGGGLVAG
jgi:hypothetical protein